MLWDHERRLILEEFTCLHQFPHRASKHQRSPRQCQSASEKRVSLKAGWSLISKATQLFCGWATWRLLSVSGDRKRQADLTCCSKTSQEIRGTKWDSCSVVLMRVTQYERLSTGILSAGSG